MANQKASTPRRNVVPDIRYTPSHRRNTHARKSFTVALKYYTYRHDKAGNQVVPDTYKFERWNDRGLGETWRQVQANCESLASKYVIAWSLVFAPAPDFFSLMDCEDRYRLMREYTDNLIGAYFEARGLTVPEYAFVVHEATAKATPENPEQYPFTHSHIVLPGTVRDEASTERIPFYNNSNRGDMDLLHQRADQEMEKMFDRELAQERQIHWRFLAGREIEQPVPEITILEPPFPAIPEPLLPTIPEPREYSKLDEFFPRGSYLDNNTDTLLDDLDPDLDLDQYLEFDIDDEE